METELYKKVEKFVEDSFAKEDVVHKHTPIHLKLTAECLRELKPDANEALLIAALSHDIDRAFVARNFKGVKGEFKSPEYLKDHQGKCAKIIRDFLMENNAGEELANKVSHLVSKHEEGGDADQDLLKDADSLSFFRGGNAKSIAEKFPNGDIKGKIDWMFERITSESAKEIARPKYEEAIKELGL